MSRSPQRWKFSRDDIPTTTAMDTETFRGQLKVICTPNAYFEPVGPEGTDVRAVSLLDWVWDHGAEIIWLWNLQFDRDILARPVLQLQKDDPEAAELLLKEHKLKVADYTITLVGAKSFSVRKKKARRKMTFFDAGNFYTVGEAHQGLDTAAKEFLGFGKNAEELGIDRARIGDTEGYYEDHRDLIIKYCMRDAELTVKLGDRLFGVAKAAMGFYPRRWASAASLSKAWTERNAPDLLHSRVADPGYHNPFRQSYRGGIFLSKLGRVEHVEEVDLVNAYGSALLKCPRIADLTPPTRTDRFSPNAVLGSYYILIDYDGRLPARKADAVSMRVDPQKETHEKILYPTSYGALRPYYADRVEMEWFISQGRRFEILTATEMFPRDPSKPVALQFPTLSKVLARVAELKTEAKHGNLAAKSEREFLKRIVNSLYGITAEAKHGETPFTTWPVASFITAWCRRLIWEQWTRIEENGGMVVSVNTDSIRTVIGNYHVPITHTGEIGKFEVKFANCIVIHYQSGIAVVLHPPDHDPKCGECGDLPRVVYRAGRWEQHPKGCACCQRDGFGAYVRRRGMPSLTAETLLNARGSELQVESKRGTHIMEGVLRHDIDDIGDIRGATDIDDTTRMRPIRLDANMMVFEMDPALLKFEVLWRQEVPCFPPNYDRVMSGEWSDARIAARRDLFATEETTDMRRMRMTTRWSQTVVPESLVDLTDTGLGDGGKQLTPLLPLTPVGRVRPVRLLEETAFPPPINGTTRTKIQEELRFR